MYSHKILQHTRATVRTLLEEGLVEEIMLSFMPSDILGNAEVC